MAARALIIAIENYPAVQVGGIAKQLPGTLQAGFDFKAWLLAKWASEGRADTQLIFCSDPVQPGGIGATADDIRGALLQLKADGQSATEELFFFFSGHGFSFVDKPGSRADFVMASDFQTAGAVRERVPQSGPDHDMAAGPSRSGPPFLFHRRLPQRARPHTDRGRRSAALRSASSGGGVDLCAPVHGRWRCCSSEWQVRRQLDGGAQG